MKRTTYAVAFSAVLALLSGCGGKSQPAKTGGADKPAANAPPSGEKMVEKAQARSRAPSTRWSRTTRPTTGTTRPARKSPRDSSMLRIFSEGRRIMSSRRHLQRRPRLPALQQGHGGEGAVPDRARTGPAVPPGPRADGLLRRERARRSGDRVGYPAAQSGRAGRQVPERRGARQPRDAADEAPRHEFRPGRRERLRPCEEEPAARARHRRRLPAGVQPARALLLRDGEDQGR